MVFIRQQYYNSPYAVTIKQPLFDRNMWARSENLAKTATYLLRRVRNISYKKGALTCMEEQVKVLGTAGKHFPGNYQNWQNMGI
jgi:hypothetical protein